MKSKRKPVAKKIGNVDLKSSTLNMLMNIAIFILVVVIIFLSYSIYLKVFSITPEEIAETRDSERSEIIQVEVLNGCGIPGAATRFAEYLRANKFDVVSATNDKEIDETLVIARTQNMENAYAVAEVLGVKKSNVNQILNDDYFLDVSIIIGRDYYTLKPLK
ncbi:MAG: LytR C-terminal domain-containing protein [Melioribacteraceae bacterium]|nr:LytR C-terminal domain-containing protein [Melioribacteraceae bacterium]